MELRATAFDGVCCAASATLTRHWDTTDLKRFARTLVERLQWTRLRLLDVYGRVDER